jgi:hypothetical protein
MDVELIVACEHKETLPARGTKEVCLDCGQFIEK